MSIKIFKQPQTQRAYYNKYQNMYNNNVYKIGIHFSSLELFINFSGGEIFLPSTVPIFFAFFGLHAIFGTSEPVPREEISRRI